MKVAIEFCSTENYAQRLDSELLVCFILLLLY